MKVGELYKVAHRWLLPLGTPTPWKTCGPVLYLGEDVIERDDGVRIVNHAVFVAGQRRIVDHTFLKFFEPLDINTLEATKE
tara:strand:+ start:291 stop:533 length:243 start_codon:yes stop_codon:yes gene_type:complete